MRAERRGGADFVANRPGADDQHALLPRTPRPVCAGDRPRAGRTGRRHRGDRGGRRRLDAARQSGHEEADPVSTLPLGHDILQFGPLRLDRTAHRFYVNGEEAELTPREFTLLEYLTEHHDTLLTRDQILVKVWGINFDTGTNMVDVYMYFLRRKLEARGVKKMIQTVRGHGYRLVLPTGARG